MSIKVAIDRWAAPTVVVASAVGIFALDTITDLEIAISVLYVAVVLVTLRFWSSTYVIPVSLACVALTILSYLLTRSGAAYSGGMNLALSLIAISATTYLALEINASERAAQAARAQLVHVARLTALGELTTSIAHETNQPLGAITLNGGAASRWLNMSPPNIEEARKSIAEIVGDANRASQIVARIRKLARRAVSERIPIDLNGAIDDVIALMGREIERARVTLDVQLSPNLPLALGDRIQLQQVMLNLVLNSIEAMALDPNGQRTLRILSRPLDRQKIEVSVCDTGPGVPVDKLTKIFEAFYTTKETGIGIGLAITRTIIEEHGGRLWANANHPRGLDIRFTFPTVAR
ncbi:sensor histidine kinase [Terrarubrum flagellatum]|uniref:sensor histidine kinase n=1 Tax=Terrirubrum flagellatum TaxID=2895980 RepID=UPI003145195C